MISKSKQALLLATVLIAHFSAPAQKPTRILQHGNSRIVSAHFSSDGAKLFSAELNGTVKAWHLKLGTIEWTLDLHRPGRMGDFTHIEIQDTTLSSDERTLAVAYLRRGVDRNLDLEMEGDQRDVVVEPHILLVNTWDGSIKKDISESDKIFHSVTFSRDDMFLVSDMETVIVGSNKRSSHSVVEIDIPSGKLKVIRELGDEVDKIAVFSDHQLFVARRTNWPPFSELPKRLFVYDRMKKDPILVIDKATNRELIYSISSDNRNLAVAGSIKDGTLIDVWDIEDVSLAKSIKEKGEFIISQVLFLKGGGILWAGGKLGISFGDAGASTTDKSGILKIYDQSKPTLKRDFKSFVNVVSYSARTSQIAVGTFNGQIQLITLK